MGANKCSECGEEAKYALPPSHSAGQDECGTFYCKDCLLANGRKYYGRLVRYGKL